MRKGIYYLIIGLVLITFLITYFTKQASKVDDDMSLVGLPIITNKDKVLEGFSSSSSLMDIKENRPTNYNISGRWVWEKNSEISTFTVDIIKEDNYYIGTYFAVAESGMKIDGDIEDRPSFKIENFNKEVIVTFKTYFSDSIGKVKLRFDNDKLHWEIIEKPKGEYYCPNVAVLKRFLKQ